MYSNCINDQFTIIGGQVCTDSVNIDLDERNHDESFIGQNILAIIPRLNFTCNGRITSIRAAIAFNAIRRVYPFFQVWRPTSVGSPVYTKIGEVQVQSDEQVNDRRFGDAEVNITLTGNNTIEFQSGDVVGYYHPPDLRLNIETKQTDGYHEYLFTGSPAPTSVNLSNANDTNNNRQPLIQFTIGKYQVFNVFTV